MFAVAFDLTVAAVQKHYPKSISQAYAEIGTALAAHGFEWTQGSVYLNEDLSADLATLYRATTALKNLPWFGACVRDIRVFRVEQWSDFTAIMKTP